MQSHLQHHCPDPLVEKVANANVLSQPAAVNAVTKAKLPFSFPKAASIMKSSAELNYKDLHRMVLAKCYKHWNQGMKCQTENIYQKKAIPAL